jgi:iron(III) transport system substrate-binding protein
MLTAEERRRVMTHRTFVRLLALLAVIGLAPAAALAQGEVRIYSIMETKELEEYIPALERATGLKARVLRMSTDEMWARIQAEKPNIQADVLLGMPFDNSLSAKKQGLLQPYDSPAWKDIPAQFKDRDGQWYGYTFWFVGACVNPQALAKKGLAEPKSWSDLTKPEYKGQITLPKPGASGTAWLMVSTVMQAFGEEKGWAFLEGLHRNSPQYNNSGTAPAQLVAQGEFPVCVSWDQAILKRQSSGYPIKLIIPAEGTGMTLNTVAIFKNAKNLEAARRVVDFVGSAESMKIIGTQRSKVTRPGIGGLVDFEPKLISYDVEWAEANHARIIKIWQERFGR